MVLTMLKLSSTKTVSVPLGNGLNVDIDVTVDVKPDQTTDNLPPPTCLRLGDKCMSEYDECCDQGAKCMPIGANPGGWEKRCAKDRCFEKGEHCVTADDCCDKEAECIILEKSSFAKPRCWTRQPAEDCIPDGEPCHGTDDWEHECCSQSCCQGKCGKCNWRPFWGWGH